MAITAAQIANNAGSFAIQIGWSWSYSPGTGRVVFEGPVGSLAPGSALAFVFLIDEQSDNPAGALARWNVAKANILAALAAA